MMFKPMQTPYVGMEVCIIMKGHSIIKKGIIIRQDILFPKTTLFELEDGRIISDSECIDYIPQTNTFLENMIFSNLKGE
ncbi:hypothetical protein [Cytobacillus sp. IB215316]|uniref:hypothetical protein n=1 Tax=Cytobacillus sp. IB215316 TaxID=3097354 RepID=UPI002A0CB9F1|nr:hypothetical protein [Cytobacillus sp. IB215316]MDX8360785.1 hypothetical protein [Cytobacillus sp. IB215316]